MGASIAGPQALLALCTRGSFARCDGRRGLCPRPASFLKKARPKTFILIHRRFIDSLTPVFSGRGFYFQFMRELRLNVQERRGIRKESLRGNLKGGERISRWRRFSLLSCGFLSGFAPGGEPPLSSPLDPPNTPLTYLCRRRVEAERIVLSAHCLDKSSQLIYNRIKHRKIFSV